jgi:hypothetical protein
MTPSFIAQQQQEPANSCTIPALCNQKWVTHLAMGRHAFSGRCDKTSETQLSIRPALRTA